MTWVKGNEQAGVTSAPCSDEPALAANVIGARGGVSRQPRGGSPGRVAATVARAAAHAAARLHGRGERHDSGRCEREPVFAPWSPPMGPFFFFFFFEKQVKAASL